MHLNMFLDLLVAIFAWSGIFVMSHFIYSRESLFMAGPCFIEISLIYFELLLGLYIAQ